MKRGWLLVLIVWLLLTGVAGADGGITAEIAQINTARYPEVTLYVSVMNRGGQVVEGLEQDDFRITEDGAAVEVIAFNAGSRTAIATVLTIDRSGSMSVEGKLTGAKSAAETFVDLMRPQDRVALVAFESKVVTLEPFTSDKTALKARIRALRAEGCTAWYDAVYQSVDLIASLDGRRSVILLSDGIDCREDLARRLSGVGSAHDLDEAIGRARSAGIPVYAIGLGRQATQKVSSEGFDEVKLRRMATETGGKYYHAPGSAELSQLYSTLSTTMQKEYVLTYRSPRPTYDGTRRNIVVNIQQDSGPGVTTRGKYLEQHLVNVRSDPRLFLAFFLPLLLLLVAPVVKKGNKETRKPEDKKGVAGAPVVAAARPAAPVAPAGPGVAPAPLDAAAPFPSPASAGGVADALAPARLTVRFPLGPGEMSIGRAPDNTIVISDPSVALHHACIAEQGGRYVVRDLSNGQTHVSFRGDPTQERPTSTNALRDGSTIRFGQVKSVLRQPPGGAGPGAVARAGVWLEIPFALKAIVAIGRDPGNHIVVNSSQVALRQAEVRQEAGRWVICDVGGGGGVRVSFSGDPAQARPVQGRNALKTGSMFYVGDVAFELQA